tara:strand:- start:2185 stop:2286 length:102 start_codon:yes stop_codon:yes gene_type:complete
MKKLPYMPIWYDKDMFISFVIGVVVGLILSWII